MELIGVLLLGFVIYLWAQSRERQTAERRALRHFSHRLYLSEVSDDAWDDWEVDFAAMTATVQRCVPERDDPPSDPLPLRRSSTGAWSVENKSAEGARDWEVVPSGVAAPLESQYQRFLLRYRGR